MSASLVLLVEPEAHAQLLSFLDEPTCPDRALTVETVEHGRSCALVARRSDLLEATVGISGSLTNTKSSVPMPFTADVAGVGPVELTRLRPRSSLKSWFFSHRVRWCPGIRGGRHDDDHIYALPYEQGRCSVVAQGAMGPYSHGPGSGSEQAIDFAMPKGSTVCAARGGVVVRVRQDSDVGGPEKRLESCANYIVVRHPDGTYANYAHLSQYSALVETGQEIETGAPLGKSGTTGFTGGPHLHFDVYRPTEGAFRETIAVAFRTAAGVARAVAPGEEYCNP
jgi:murein DD-endopeptidase MepM/ murein hydrolase activator NlpD